MSDDRAAAITHRGPGRSDPSGARAVDSGTLFDGAREIVLVHNGERYRLRVTQNGKLILTK